MVKGSKNYFRHYIGARNDDFIIGLMKEFGPKGYFMWFALIEICSEQALNGHHPPYTYHESRLYQELKCTRHRLNLFLTYAESMCKLCSTYVQPKYNIDVFNLPKFIGSYSQKVPNKRKEKKIKEKKNKEKEIKEKEINNSSDNYGPELNLLKFWNNQNIIVHTKTENLLKELRAKRKRKEKYSDADLIQAIENYAGVLNSEETFFNHRWTLKEFLQQENTEKFFPDNFVPTNYLKNPNSSNALLDKLKKMENPYA